MGVVYFVDELVDVDRVECLGHVEGGEDCSIGGGGGGRGGSFETSDYGVIDLMQGCGGEVCGSEAVLECWEDCISGDVWEDDFF